MRIIASFEKGLNILEYITLSGGKTRTSEVAAACNIPASNIVLFLNTLTKNGYLTKNAADGRYYISSKLSYLASQISISLYGDLKNLATNIIPKLQQEIDENILIAVLNHNMLEFIYRSQSSKNIQIINSCNSQLYTPHATAAGKVILAFLDNDTLNKYLKFTKFEKYTNRTLTSKDALIKELKQIRDKHYAINYGEYEEEIMALGAPVFFNDKIIASLVVQFPKFRYQDSELDDYATTIKQYAEIFTAELNKT